MTLVHGPHFALQGLRVFLMQSLNVVMHMYLWHFIMALKSFVKIFYTFLLAT